MIVVPYARDAVSNRASGDSLEFTWEEFLDTGVDRLNWHLDHFHDQDPDIPSEFYQRMSEPERQEIKNSSIHLMVSKLRHITNAKIRRQDQRECLEIDYPLPNQIIEYLKTRLG
ncbi:hypothetical protein MFFC18_21120 [Mariniblastus fucicola]|uniref:Uncharacterized protein n=1 Tax=Mariniblastus fucicola TaxID=980251 RepID=A0A5B9PCH9_9BACT|nr:hypothetical protein MFFC18_21120 [Mariniblastus fucicola]